MLYRSIFFVATLIISWSDSRAIGNDRHDKNEVPHVVFLINEDPDNYEAPRTIPVFAESLRREHNMMVTVLLGEGERAAFRFPNLEVISGADLIVVFARRIALPHDQLDLIRSYLKQGKPLVGIRTANHAFSVTGQVGDGHEAWPEFVSEILGCENRGYGPQEAGVDVAILPEAKNNPVLTGVEPTRWHSEGSIYHVAPLLDRDATVLVTGRLKEKVEPIAWTRYTADQSRVFYTSLGYPSDFDKPQFRNLLVNGIFWALDLERSVPLLTYESAGNISAPVNSPTAWAQKREQILEKMQRVMGKLPDRSDLPPLDMKVTDRRKSDHYSRLTVRLRAAENEFVSAYLYIPKKIRKAEKRPAMLVLHGTGDGGKKLVDGQSPLANRALARELAERGYVVIAPDYPSMGDSRDYDFERDRYLSGTMKGIFNHMRCVDLLQELPEVDPDRIGVIGHSLGGHNAMFVGAFDPRIKVIVSSCGWTLFDYYDIGEEASKKYGGRLGPWAQDRYMPLMRDRYGLDAGKIPFDFDEVIAALAPRPFFSNSPLNDSNFEVAGVRKGISAALEVYRFLNAEENLQVRYPEAGHDFPREVRLQSYRFTDNALAHTPKAHEME